MSMVGVVDWHALRVVALLHVQTEFVGWVLPAEDLYLSLNY